MTKSVKIALMKELLLKLPREAAAMVRAKEQHDEPLEDRLTSEEWDGLFEWLDEVKRRTS